MTSLTSGAVESPPPAGTGLTPTITMKKDGDAQQIEYLAEKTTTGSDTSETELEKGSHRKKAPKTARELVSEILELEDDPTVNPWTFRMWFIGIGISVFGG
jgi:hypothetical protein